MSKGGCTGAVYHGRAVGRIVRLMPRIKLEEHARYPFSIELEVRVADLNYGAHLGYERLLSLAHQARVRMFDGLGATELDLGDGATGIVAADVAVTYLAEAFLNDVLVFEIKPVEIGLVAFRLAHRVANKGTGKKVALIEIGFVGFDARRRAPGRLPDPFIAALRAMDGESGN
jgi:acyl-CoA thioesterase FadM